MHLNLFRFDLKQLSILSHAFYNKKSVLLTCSACFYGSVSAFLASCEDRQHGGFSKAPGEPTDLLHSFYALLFKSLAGHPGVHVSSPCAHLKVVV